MRRAVRGGETVRQPYPQDPVLTDLSARINGVRSRKSNLATQVVEAIRSAIHDRQIPLGAKLANENVLAAQLDISRATLREAIRILSHEGLLVSRRGIGTFVSDHVPPRIKSGLERMSSTTDLIIDAGSEPGTRDLAWAVEPAPPEVAEALGLEPLEAVAVVHRTRLIDGQPLMRTQEYLPLPVIGDAALLDGFDGRSLYAFLKERLGLRVSHCASTITAEKATVAVAQVLEVLPGEALLVLKQVHFNGRGERVLYSVNHHNPALMEFYLVRTEVNP
jgi:GntR family transcriptional regulator